MKINELQMPDRKADAILALKQADWHILGDGSYATVFMKPGIDYVLKLFDSDDTAYADYIKLVLTHPNPHFPKFKGKLVKVTTKYYAVRMEKLNPYRNRNDDMLSDISLYLYYKGVMPARHDPSFTTAKEHLEAYPTLKDACDLIITNLLDKHIDDIHTENVMLRGDTIVITDPVQ